MPPSRRWWKTAFGLTLAVVAGESLWRRHSRRQVRLVAVPVVRRSLDGFPLLGLTPVPSLPESSLLAPAGLLAFDPAPPEELRCKLKPRALAVRRKTVPAPEPEVFVMSYPTSSIGQRLAHWAFRLGDAVLYCVLQPFVNRRLRLASAAVMVAFILWSVRSAIEPAVSAASRPLRERAAFTWEESFEDGLRVRDLTLLDKTMSHQSYVVDFQARVDKRSIGWVVRSAGADDYTVFKLTERGRTPQGVKFDLVHYPVVGGRVPAPVDREAVHLVAHPPEDNFLNISVRVTEDQILILVNGFGVDTRKRPADLGGGFGFLAENGESFLVRSVTISGNDDFLGVFLSGAEQTIRRLAALAPRGHKPLAEEPI